MTRRIGPSAAAAEPPPRRALVVDTRWPVVGRDAGSQAILSHIRALQSLGYAISFVAADQMNDARAGIDELSAAGVACCRAPFYASAEDVLHRQTGCFDVVYLHRAAIATRYLGLTRRYMPQARVIYSVADLHHVRLERQAAVEERPELLAASRRMRIEESVAAWSADTVIAHSIDEVELLHKLVPEANVHHVPWAVPARKSSVRFAARQGLAFVGGYAHTPNVDAACWLVEAVMPLVWHENPQVPCLLAGSDMPEVVRRLERPGVTLLGKVADLDGLFDAGAANRRTAALRCGRQGQGVG